MWHKLYQKLIEPKSRREDDRRREYVLNILLLGSIGLVLAATAVAGANAISSGDAYGGVSLIILLAVTLSLISIYGFSRLRFSRVAAYLFIAFFFILGTYPTFIWGIQLPQAILIYSLVTVMAGILTTGWMAFVAALLSSLALYIQVVLQQNGIIFHNLEWAQRPGEVGDVIVFGVTLLVIALVSWLSSREVEKSFRRARLSEAALRKERNSLQVKVAERTRELEQAQVEKMLELHRFAEFGRISAALLHDLANPLTIVSLNLQQMGQKQQSHFVSQARKGVAHMEEYLAAARRQLQQQRDVVVFDVANEVKQVTSLLETKARTNKLGIKTDLVEKLKLEGDVTQFHHVVANLISNAIDAYEGVDESHERTIEVTTKKRGGAIELSVQDHGVGISAETREHIFEPFFTTKGGTRGTGLGLAIIKQAVEEDFGGKIEVTSKPNRGTRFTVYLPVHE